MFRMFFLSVIPCDATLQTNINLQWKWLREQRLNPMDEFNCDISTHGTPRYWRLVWLCIVPCHWWQRHNSLESIFMMTSSNGNIFRVTGPLCGEFTGPGEFPTQRPVTRSFDISLICTRINGDLRRNRAHCDVTVMLRRLKARTLSILWPFFVSVRKIQV